MPNHNTTIGICSPGYDFDVDEFNERHKETNICAVARPIPEPLEEVKVGHHHSGLQRWKEKNGVAVPVDEAELKRQFGHADWLAWARANWGTKWGAYRLSASSLPGDGCPIVISFASAWRSPSNLDDIAAWLFRVYNFEKIAWIGFDPYDDETQLISKHVNAGYKEED